MFDNLSESTKMALLVGGVATAAGVGFYFLQKHIAQNSLATTPGGTGWSPATTFNPGSQYMVAATLPTTGVLTRANFESALGQAGWSNGKVLYYPGDPISNWPSEIAQPTDTTQLQNMVIFQGQWNLPAAPVVAGTMTALVYHA